MRHSSPPHATPRRSRDPPPRSSRRGSTGRRRVPPDAQARPATRRAGRVLRHRADQLAAHRCPTSPSGTALPAARPARDRRAHARLLVRPRPRRGRRSPSSGSRSRTRSCSTRTSRSGATTATAAGPGATCSTAAASCATSTTARATTTGCELAIQEVLLEIDPGCRAAGADGAAAARGRAGRADGAQTADIALPGGPRAAGADCATGPTATDWIEAAERRRDGDGDVRRPAAPGRCCRATSGARALRDGRDRGGRRARAAAARLPVHPAPAG